MRAVAARAKPSRLKLLLQSFRAAAMDGLAHLGFAFDRRALALAADRIHDRSLIAAIGVAGLGAGESHVNGCLCYRRFERVQRLMLDARRFDAVEDGHYGRAFADVGAGQRRIRVVASTAERLIDGRQP